MSPPAPKWRLNASHPHVTTMLRFTTLFAFMAIAANAMADDAGDKEAQYVQDITKRADKIVEPLAIADDATKARVRDLIVAQYKSLRDIHATRDTRLQQAKQSPATDATIAEAWTKVARDSADLKLNELHRRFVARLSVELDPEQVDKVKDGLTYNVVNVTFGRYQELFPNLKDEEKREILAQLREARELAMDGGSSDEKHAIFGKFKGRINNYLSKAGYDMKQAEKDLAARKKDAASSK